MPDPESHTSEGAQVQEPTQVVESIVDGPRDWPALVRRVLAEEDYIQGID